MSLDSTREICRICLETTALHFSLLKTVSVGEDDVFMSKILIYCADVEVLHDDGKPQNACFTCIENAVAAYRFKIMCLQSETTLNTEIFKKTFNECDPLEIKKEEDIIDVSNVEIHNIKEEQTIFDNLEVCSDDFVNDQQEDNIKDDYNNDQWKDSSNCFQFKNEQRENKDDDDVENAGETKKNEHNCSTCGKIFKYRRYLLRHHRTHNKRKCHYCNFKAEGRDVTLHMSNMHDDKKTVKCHSCDLRFFEQHSLKRHMIIHTNVKPHVCGVCDETFRWADLLRVHMLGHSREPLYSCSLCNKKFYKKGDQIVHMNIHTKTESV